MTTSTDLRVFGFRELKIGAELLEAYCENPLDFLCDGVHLMMNTHSGYVLLTDEDYNVAMMNGDKLEQFLSRVRRGRFCRGVARQSVAPCRLIQHCSQSIRSDSHGVNGVTADKKP